MKQVRFSVAAVALMLATSFVFANKAKFITQALYASTSNSAPTTGNSVQLTASVNLIGFNTIGANQVQIVNPSVGTTRYAYAYDGVSTFTKLYAAAGW